MNQRLRRWLAGANTLKNMMNLWPPFLASGIRIDHIDENYRTVEVSLLQRFYNRNYVGTHFGGSLFAMLDPFYMLMIMRNLGERYYVWDQSGSIDFVSPGRGRVFAALKIDEAFIDSIRAATSTGEKYCPELTTAIYDEKNQVVARYRKKIYIRLKEKYRPEP